MANKEIAINFRKNINEDPTKNPLYELFPGIIANTEQIEAIDKMVEFLHSSDTEFNLTGRGGTGKTTIIKKTVEYYIKEVLRRRHVEVYDDTVFGMTISHAAKNVLRDSLSFINVYTVAKALGMKMSINEETGEIEFNPDAYIWKVNPPPVTRARVIIIDECSMISQYLLDLIRDNVLQNCKLIFMGDNVQIPAIDKDRQPNEDSPTFNIVRKAKLVQRMRQGEDSPIVKLSDLYAENIERFNKTGRITPNPLTKELRVTNFDSETKRGVIFTNNVKAAIASVVRDFQVEEAKGNPNFVKVIAYRNKNVYGKAPYNLASINNVIRRHLWNTDEEFVVGETVVANNHYAPMNEVLLHNSQTLIITKKILSKHLNIDCIWLDLLDIHGESIKGIPVVSAGGRKEFNTRALKLKKQAWADKRQWKNYYDFLASFAEIGYGYAISSHKAQGSTYKNVYIFEEDIFGVAKTTPKEKNQAMYVAVTRASHKLVIINKENG